MRPLYILSAAAIILFIFRSRLKTDPALAAYAATYHVDPGYVKSVNSFVQKLYETTYTGADGFNHPIADLPVKWGKVTGLDPLMIEAIIWAESRGKNVKTPEGNGLYSYGLMQVMPDAASEVGYRGKPEGLMDPNTNIQYGSKYFLKMYQNTGQDLAMAAASYNCGLSGARQRLAQYGDPQDFPFPTGVYVKSVLKFYEYVTAQNVTS